jgi:hypothetical protein
LRKCWSTAVQSRSWELSKERRRWFTRKNGVITALVWFILFVMMLPSFFAIANEEELAAVSAVFGVFSSLIMMVLSLALPSSKSQKIDPNLTQAALQTLYGNTDSPPALPPQQSRPVTDYASPAGAWRANTADRARPGSVTEETTKLLKKDAEG